MYTVEDYANMFAEPLRRAAFLDTMRSAISSETVVLDLGAGTGIASLLACKLGARHVYAIDPSPVIRLLPAAAGRNGWADKITVFCEDSRKVDLPERVDLIVADIRGRRPVCNGAKQIMSDACLRFLKPKGQVIPGRDRIYVAPVSEPDYDDTWTKLWVNHGLGIDLSSYGEFTRGKFAPLTFHQPIFLSPEQLWGSLTFVPKVELISSEELIFKVDKGGRLDGFAVWFDLDFLAGISLTNKPGEKQLPYGRGCFLLGRPVLVSPGYEIRLTLRVHFQGDKELFIWKGAVYDESQVEVAKFQESDLKQTAIQLESLRSTRTTE